MERGQTQAGRARILPCGERRVCVVVVVECGRYGRIIGLGAVNSSVVMDGRGERKGRRGEVMVFVR